MDISPVQSGTTQVENTGQAALGKADFLKLLTEQLKNQDPTNPLDDKAFVTQLAQFSSLEQAMAMNDKLAMLQLSQSAVVNAQMAGLVGKSVLVKSTTVVVPASGDPSPVTLHLGGDAAKVTVRVVDGKGNVVRTLDPGALTAGTHAVPWDGKDASGSRLPAGSYKVEVIAKDLDGQKVTADNELLGTVTGIAFDSGQAELELGSVRVKPADVVEITNP